MGRGLGALLGSAPTSLSTRGIGTLPIAQIQPGAFQPRQAISPDTLEELTASIKANGVIQAIVVRHSSAESPHGPRYEIIAGERRWQAAKLAGLSEIPAVVRELSDKEALAIGLIENIQREDLTAADEARALKRLVTEFGLTQQAVADSVGRSRAAVANLIRLLELPASVIQMIDSKALGMGHARALLAVVDPAELAKTAEAVVTRALSVRETEKLVRRHLKSRDPTLSRKLSSVVEVTELFSTKSTTAHLHQHPNGGGKIVIDFADLQSRDELLAFIKPPPAL